MSSNLKSSVILWSASTIAIEFNKYILKEKTMHGTCRSMTK